MRDDGGAAVGAALVRNRTLTSVQLCGNRLGDATAAAIAIALLGPPLDPAERGRGRESEGGTGNRALRELDLADNAVGTAGGVALARALAGTRGLCDIFFKKI